MPTVRELTAEFNFEVDTTPAERFNAAITKTKNNLKGLSGANIGAIGKGLKRAFRVGAAGLAAGIGAGVVTALKFGDIKQALSQLEFQFKGSLKPLRDEVQAILDDPVLGKLTTELELLNSAAQLAGEGIDRSFIVRNLRDILGFSAQFRQNIGEGTSDFINFLKSGNLDILIKAGKVTAEQAQFLRAAGIDSSKEGIKARAIRLEALFKDISPQIRTSIEKLIDEGALSQRRFINSLDALTVELGEKTLPAFQGITERAIKMLDLARFDIKDGEKGVAITGAKVLFPFFSKIILDAAKSEDTPFKAVERFLTGAIQEGRTNPKGTKALFPDPEPGAEGGVGNQNNVYITVESGATADTNALRTMFRDEMSKTFGRSVISSKNSTMKRGAGQVR